jgi:hypothetical protein
MSLRPALLTTIFISIIVRIIIGLILIDANYELETVIYKYIFVFAGLIFIVSGLRKVWVFYSVFRFTR